MPACPPELFEVVLFIRLMPLEKVCTWRGRSLGLPRAPPGPWPHGTQEPLKRGLFASEEG